MHALEIARKMAALDEKAEAVKAFKLALNECQGVDEMAEMECALYILQFGSGKDYKVSFSTFVDLHKRGFMQSETKDIMTLAFYLPNSKMQKKRYEKNCRLLKKYPYIFRRDFPDFEDLPVKFYPFDDNKYVPYDVREQGFGDFFAPQHQVISHNFFADLEKPILAADVFSQYELEYLNDNVRRSEHIGRENHIYLHYTDWQIFCSYLVVWDLADILKERKIVYLIEDEIEQYPIDFKERYGIDYSQYPVRMPGIREYKRLIWHTQLSAHNGGDFFNEILDAHPNILAWPSDIFEELVENFNNYERKLKEAKNFQQAKKNLGWADSQILEELYNLSNRTLKDILVALYCINIQRTSPNIDKTSRIVPVIFFQPHFYNILYDIYNFKPGVAKLISEQYENLCKSSFLSDFKYIKTFTPMRRITTSYGATVKFMLTRDIEHKYYMNDAVITRVLNRSFMIDWQNRLFKDSVLVRFEDGKLNPKATFTALAAFLDLPYTESMTYCSLFGERDPESLEGNDIGFSTAAVYRTYDDYTNDAERAFIEYFMRDVYEYYGYDFHYYQGQPVDKIQVMAWIKNFDKINYFMRMTLPNVLLVQVKNDMKQQRLDEKILPDKLPEMQQDVTKLLIDDYMKQIEENRLKAAEILMGGLRFVNKNGQPLHMMKKLELDPALLEQPLYR